jgi:hypothetical protein
VADPSAVQVADQLLVRPATTLVEGRPVFAKRPAASYPQGLAPVLEMVIRDGLGRPLDLSSAGLHSENPASSSSSSAGSGESGRLLLRLREVFSFRTSAPPVEVEGVCWDARSGTVRARMPSVAAEAPGVMVGEWGVFDGNNVLVTTYDFLLHVERGQFGAVVTGRGLPAVDEVRAWMRDNDPNDNYLLRTLEFDLSEILESMVDCVRHWNDSHPAIRQKYNTCTFGNPSAMRSGIMARLYQLAAKHYRRNQLAYSAGGTSIDDKNKSQEYEALAQQMWTEYVNWCRTDKARINRDNFAGTHGSPYGWHGGHGS